MRIDATTASPLHYKAELENDRLGQWDLIDPATGKDKEVTVVIESAEVYRPAKPKLRKMADGTKKAEKVNKREIRFVGKRKSWIANITCQEQIARLHGNKTQGWIGKKIRLYVDHDVMIGREKVGGIRVRGTVPTDEPTTATLDADVDAAKREQIDNAIAG
jgi:hypothetical protein